MGWLEGKSTGNHRFSHEIWEFPVIFPLNQSIEFMIQTVISLRKMGQFPQFRGKVWEPNTKMEASCGTLGYIAPEAAAARHGSGDWGTVEWTSKAMMT